MQEAIDTIIGFLDNGGTFERINGEDGTLTLKFVNGSEHILLIVDNVSDDDIKTSA